MSLVLLGSFLSAVLEGLGLGLIIPFFQSLIDQGAEPMRVGIDWLDRLLGADEGPLVRLYRVASLILVAMWLRAIIGYAARFLGARMRESILDELRTKLMNQMHRVSISYLESVSSSQVISALTNDIGRVRNLMVTLVDATVSSFMCAVYLAGMLWISWEMTILIIAFFGGLALAIRALMPWIARAGTRVTKAQSIMTGTAMQIVSGMRTIRSFGTRLFEQDRFADKSGAVATLNTKAASRRLVIMPLLQATTGTLLIVIIIVAYRFFILEGQMDPALLLAFLFALFRFMPIANKINEARGRISERMSSAQLIAEILNPDDKPYMKDGTRSGKRLDHAIEFEGVDFSYNPETPVLKDISISIPAGRTTAIVGGSGAGKSTLVDLISRFHDPNAGRVTFDGIDLREFKIEELRSGISIVSQSTFLFDDTIRANIAYGLEGVSDADVLEAATKAHALEFIEESPEGLDAQIGERGSQLSGGQRQRLAIARAILRNPDILILDEATSALDSISERYIQEALEELIQDRTVIVIAHRLSTVEDADWVIVLEDGLVSEEGTYQDLLDRKGKLWEYHSLQFQLEG